MNEKIKVIELLSEISKEKNPIFRKDGGEYKNSVWTFIISYFDKQMTHEEIVDWLNSEVEILEDEEEINIKDIEEFMEHLKQSEVEIVHKIGELIEKVNELDKKINKEH